MAAGDKLTVMDDDLDPDHYYWWLDWWYTEHPEEAFKNMRPVSDEERARLVAIFAEVDASESAAQE
jgi:hypothetical protein